MLMKPSLEPLLNDSFNTQLEFKQVSKLQSAMLKKTFHIIENTGDNINPNYFNDFIEMKNWAILTEQCFVLYNCNLNWNWASLEFKKNQFYSTVLLVQKVDSVRM